MKCRKPLPPHGFIGKTFTAIGADGKILYESEHLWPYQRNKEREEAEQRSVDAVIAAVSKYRPAIDRYSKVKAGQEISRKVRRENAPTHEAVKAENARLREQHPDWKQKQIDAELSTIFKNLRSRQIRTYRNHKG